MAFIGHGGSRAPDDEVQELAKLGIGLSSEEVVARAKGKKESDGPSAEENEDEDKNKKQRNKHLWRKYMKIITMVRMRRFVDYTLGLIIRC